MLVPSPPLVKSWADIEHDNDDDTNEGLTTYLPDGTKIITTYYRDADGRQMKCDRKYKVQRRVVKVPKAVKERQKAWKKFGLDSLNFNKNPDYKKYMTITTNAQDELLKPPRNFGLLANDAHEDFSMLVTSGTELNVQKRQLQDIQRYFEMLSNPDPRPLLVIAEKDEVAAAAAAAAATTAMVPERHARPQDNDDRTVRVTNLPEYTDEVDLITLFNRCGAVQRHFLARNKETHVSRGYAFITYKSRSEAETAIRKLHKVGFQNVLLNVEWSKRKSTDQPQG